MISRSLVLGAALPFLFLTSADATMGAKTMFDRLDTDHDGTVSRSEVIAAAGPGSTSSRARTVGMSPC